MYAIIKLGGHQHRVEKDMILLCEKTGHAPGEEFSCSEVFFVGEGASSKVGTPRVEGAEVKLKVLEETRAPRILGFKYKKRKNYSRRWGHRQNLQKLQVLAVKA